MNSSKEPDRHPDWGDDAEAFALGEQARRQNRTVVRRVGVLAGALVLAGAAAWFFFGPRPARLLAEARAALAPTVFSSDEAFVVKQAAQVEKPLRSYLRAGGSERSSARLLHNAALMLREGPDASRVLSHNPMFAESESKVVPAECATGDLAIGASAYARRGEVGRAEALIAEALRRGDRREEILRLAGDIRFRMGRDRDVLRHAEELARLAPRDPLAYRWMGMIYAQRGFTDKVIEADRHLIELAPDHAAEIRRRLVGNLISNGQAKEARAEFDLLRKTAPELAAENPVLEARLVYLEGDAAKAEAIVARALEKAPRDRDALLLGGKIDTARGRPAEAIAALRSLVEADPTDDEACYLLGQAYARQGDRAQAQRYLQQHRRVADLKVKLYEMEREAAWKPRDAELRDRIASLYEELGWPERVAFWRAAARSARGE